LLIFALPFCSLLDRCQSVPKSIGRDRWWIHDIREQNEGRVVRKFEEEMLVGRIDRLMHGLFKEGFPLDEFIRNEKGDFE
jgi:hypothetical protein